MASYLSITPNFYNAKLTSTIYYAIMTHNSIDLILDILTLWYYPAYRNMSQKTSFQLVNNTILSLISVQIMDNYIRSSLMPVLKLSISLRPAGPSASNQLYNGFPSGNGYTSGCALGHISNIQDLQEQITVLCLVTIALSCRLLSGRHTPLQILAGLITGFWQVQLLDAFVQILKEKYIS